MSKKLRVLLDLSPLTSRQSARTGLARVALSLGEGLALHPEVELSTCAWGALYASADFQKVGDEFPVLNALPADFSALERAYLTYYSKCLAAGRALPLWLIRCGQVLNQVRNPLRGYHLDDFDVVHSTYARFPRAVPAKGVARVLTLHDLTPFKLPKAMMPAGQLKITQRIVDSICPEDAVVCVSEHTRQDFLEYSGHPEARAFVVPNGVDLEQFSVCETSAVQALRDRLGLGDAPYLMTLSSLATHKNLALIFKLWPLVREAFPHACLVIAGGKSTNVADVRERLGVAAGASADGIIMTGFISDDELAMLNSGCNAFLFPSLYEGFGLPVLEAMACGAPVIASNASSIPEVYGSVGLGLEPTDEAGWTEAMIEALRPGRRADPDLAARTHAEAFSWAAAAQGYLKVYQTIE